MLQTRFKIHCPPISELNYFIGNVMMHSINKSRIEPATSSPFFYHWATPHSLTSWSGSRLTPFHAAIISWFSPDQICIFHQKVDLQKPTLPRRVKSNPTMIKSVLKIDQRSRIIVNRSIALFFYWCTVVY